MTRSLFNPLSTRAAAAQNVQGKQPNVHVLHRPPQGGSRFRRHGDCVPTDMASGENRATAKQAGIKIKKAYLLPLTLAGRRLAPLSCVCLVALCAACNTFAPAPRDASMLPLQSEFTLYEETAPAPDQWWRILESEEVDRLVERALAGNLTLEQVLARLDQAEAFARQTRAPLYPSVDIVGDTSLSRRRVDTGDDLSDLEILNRRLSGVEGIVNPNTSPAPTTSLEAIRDALRAGQARVSALEEAFGPLPSTRSTSTSRSYRFGLGSSYEVDLWGRIRALHRASLLDLEATQEDVYGAMLSLSGAVVQQWLTVVAQRQELALVQKQLELNKTTLELMEHRYVNGLANALDVFQQRQIVAQTESVIPPLESRLLTARNELAVLLGETPRTELDLDAAVLPAVGPLPEPGLPADLLARRPDLRARGLDLRAADWRVGAARADRLPSLRLSGSATYGADDWDLVFDNWVATLAASLTGPLFDAGLRKAEVDRARAVVDERLAAYRQNVLEAMLEVENGLLQESKQVEFIAALERELESARAAHDQAVTRYRNGLIDYLPVLAALQELQVLERRLVQAHFTRLNLRVQTCIALGGTWMEDELTALAGANNNPAGVNAGAGVGTQ